MTDLNKEREAFELFELNKRPCATPASLFERFDSNDLGEDEQHYVGRYVDSYMQEKWELWQKAKAQAVPEHIITLQRNGEVFKFDLLDLLRRSLKSSKVLKTRENWSHVSKMVGIGSTTSTLLCKAMKVDPDGLSFVESESGAEG
ncbi:hypothetical protein ACSRBF_11140 [Acinetobacter baumannii]|uniref:hypothetical protein n=1 Tax=Acinetobacter baumannii TaxID=470 RepID=UPI001D186B01|nr:hypothetical protein [Acinetobacter baumannii]MCZ2455988.1 hypothetical protein [Acinetobacter baumannii]